MSGPKEMTPSELTNFIALVYETTGIKMDQSKRSLLNNRLRKRVEALKLASFADYYALVKDPQKKTLEMPRFIDAVTTNETYFFRSPKVWEYFSKEFLPQWWEKSGKARLNIWCGAASSGEEPYTIAVLCQEFMEKNPGFSWSMRATDISSEMIDRCNDGLYSGRSIETLAAPLQKKYFDNAPDNAIRAKANLKKNITFSTHKLQTPFPHKGFDIILLRNVMIYFDAPTKEVVLKNMHAALKPNGILVVGEAEGLINVKCDFKYQSPAVYTKTGS